jgi:hypothetical protein
MSNHNNATGEVDRPPQPRMMAEVPSLKQSQATKIEDEVRKDDEHCEEDVATAFSGRDLQIARNSISHIEIRPAIQSRTSHNDISRIGDDHPVNHRDTIRKASNSHNEHESSCSLPPIEAFSQTVG